MGRRFEIVIEGDRHESHRHHQAGRPRGAGSPRRPDARAAGRPGPRPGPGLRAEPGRPDAGRGHYPAPPGCRPTSRGWSSPGEVDALGPDVVGPLEGRRPGLRDRRRGGLRPSTSSTHERMAVPIPATSTSRRPRPSPRSSSPPTTRSRPRAGSRPGERVLIHAVGSGVGSAAVQLAHAMGCTVFGTSRTAEKLEQAADARARRRHRHVRRGLRRGVPRRTGGAGVDVVIDLHRRPRRWRGTSPPWRPAAGSSWSACSAGGRRRSTCRPCCAKRITVVGTTLRARPLEEKIAATRRFAERVVPWLERGLVRPVVDRVFAFEDVRRGRRQRLEVQPRLRQGRPAALTERSVGLELAVLDLQHEVVGRDEPAVVGDDDQGRLPLGLEPAEDPVDLVAGLASRARRSARRPGRGSGP